MQCFPSATSDACFHVLLKTQRTPYPLLPSRLELRSCRPGMASLGATIARSEDRLRQGEAMECRSIRSMVLLPIHCGWTMSAHPPTMLSSLPPFLHRHASSASYPLDNMTLEHACNDATTNDTHDYTESSGWSPYTYMSLMRYCFNERRLGDGPSSVLSIHASESSLSLAFALLFCFCFPTLIAD
jgi:hypothetical protein